MLLKDVKKRPLLCLIIIGACIAVTGYILYDINGVLTLVGTTEFQHFDSTEREYFIYSKTDTLTVAREIRDKNCRVSRTSQTYLKCLQLQKCNNANTTNNLPEACVRRFPRCIIIGVYKGGTRELLDYLAMHPDIVIKGPHYELCFFTKNLLWKQDLDWYRQQMPLSMPNQITIEKCPQYFPDPNSPARISDMDPDIKLILIVRDPVDRTIAHMSFKRNKSAEYIINVANNKTRDVTGKFDLSFYDEAFERYLKYFNRSQIHVVDSVRFKNEPYSVLHETETFLGLPHLIKEEDLVFNKKKGFYCLKNVEGDFATCYDECRGREGVQTTLERIKPILKDTFKPHNERFFNLIGQRFSWQ